MTRLYLPDYRGGSIVNLMASIAARFGHDTGYAPLRLLPAKTLQQYTNVVLIVIDGLGSEFLKRNGQDGFMARHCAGHMTSVFPSTTAACITTFGTGVAPQQHAVTGWFTHLKELGVVSKILFTQARFGGRTFGASGIKPEQYLGLAPIYDRLRADSYIVIDGTISRSEFNTALAGRAAKVPCRSLAGMFRAITETIGRDRRPKFISAYWPDLDDLCHHEGLDGAATLKHFHRIDRELARFHKSLDRGDTIVLVTADHGLTATPRERAIDLKDHPALQQCLLLPLCGEPRLASCYVRPDRAARFRQYVRTELKHCCRLLRAPALIAKNYYGLGQPHPKLYDRVGDYLLAMEDGCVIKDFLPGEEETFLLANHGGLSKEEMLVPLIVLK